MSGRVIAIGTAAVAVAVADDGMVHQLDVDSGATRSFGAWSSDGAEVSVSRAGADGLIVQLHSSRAGFEVVGCDLGRGVRAARMAVAAEALLVEGDVDLLARGPAAFGAWEAEGPVLLEPDLPEGRLELHGVPWLENMERGFGVWSTAATGQVLVWDRQLGDVSVYDLDLRERVLTLPIWPGSSTPQPVGETSVWLLHGSKNGALLRLNNRTWQVESQVDVTSSLVSVDPDGEFAAVFAGAVGPVRLLDLSSGEVVGSVDRPRGYHYEPALVSERRLVFWVRGHGFVVRTFD